MLRKSKKDDSGVKLEVNGRILGSCTDLMAVGLCIVIPSIAGVVTTVYQVADSKVTGTTSRNCWSRKGND